MNHSVMNTARLLGAGLRALLMLTLVTGVIYPLVVTGIAQGLFPDKANGSEVTANGEVVGSSLIGQSYNLPPQKGGQAPEPDLRWFQGRPAGGLGTNSVNTQYQLLLSGATNLSADSEDLRRRVEDAKAAVIKANSVPGYTVKPSQVPADAVTSSGSGLDPDISPRYARLQVHRVAARNGLPVAQVEKLVEDTTEGRVAGFIGEPRVNVLELNIALRDLVAKR
ncbi:potassium-transporting ATPase subunit C [Streptomyces luomodiensis]|uniref:Potassium-transporting ATPase KdpC subunit n=1 Tax=Streptomyces luomodiensis TaxID=3026192 RepID=A0ABY9V7U3_9ACTN|nr:potassium-transporting ATPase subunit C [Streptomyces sp. SCA4-21]WNF00677.1 potassium-transporting ATPase subunit C [Streptomyces sp. SCA4-21]